MNQLSIAQLRSIHDHFAKVAIGHFAKSGSAAAQVFMLRAGPKGPEKIASMAPELVRQLMSSSDSKSILGGMMRAMVRTGSPLRSQMQEQVGFVPNVLVQISEAWIVAVDTEAEALALNAQGKSLAKMPNRKEVLIVTLHTEAKSYVTLHAIEDKPLRRCVFHAFEDGSNVVATGRFAGTDGIDSAAVESDRDLEVVVPPGQETPAEAVARATAELPDKPTSPAKAVRRSFLHHQEDAVGSGRR